MPYKITPEQMFSVTDAEKAFGTTRLLPKLVDIPQQFMDGDTVYNDIANAYFYGHPMPKGDVQVHKEFQVEGFKEAFQKLIIAHLKSWDPKHEHKMGGVAYMMSLITTVTRS